MRVILRVLLVPLFIVSFLLFLLTSTIRFQLLNDSYLIHSFRRNHVYEKIPGFLGSAITEREKELEEDEEKGYRAMTALLKPSVIQKILENNIREIIPYLNGGKDPVRLYIPFRTLGIPVKERPTSDYIPVTTLIPSAKNSTLLIHLHRAGMYSWLAWVLSVMLVIGVGTVFYKLSKFGKKSTQRLLLGNAVLFTALGIFLQLFLRHLTQLLSESREPSQRMISILSSSVLPEVIYIWMGIAAGAWIGSLLLPHAVGYGRKIISRSS